MELMELYTHKNAPHGLYAKNVTQLSQTELSSVN